MSINSYAQNFEDVLLWRALGQVENGFYLDIGAQDPIFDSVSKGFYERGWRGLHVEPTSQYSEMLRRDRPDETVVQAAVSTHVGMIRFFEIPDTGMSTISADIAKQAADAGWRVNETLVPAITLDQVFATIDRPEIHWLKIDVEGHEKELLESWVEAPQRPWIIVIEAIKPGSRELSYRSWNPLLTGKGYAFVYFDGVNRYYVSDAHKDLKKHFQFGPCLWDEFQVPEISRLARTLNQRHADAIGEIKSIHEAEQALATLQQETDAANDALADAYQKVAQLGADLRLAQAETQKSRQSVLDLQQAHARAQAEAGEALQFAIKQHEQTSADLDATRAERDLLIVEGDTLNGQLAEAAAAAERAMAEQAAAAIAFGKVHDELEHALAELNEIHDLFDEVCGELVEMRDERDEARLLLIRKHQELDRANARMADLRGQLDGAQEEAEETRASLDLADGRRHEAEARARALEERLASTRAELDGKKADLDYAHVVLGQVRSELAAVTTSVAAAEESFASAQATARRDRSELVDGWAVQRARLAAMVEEATGSLGWRIAAKLSGAVRALGGVSAQLAALPVHGSAPPGIISLKDLLATCDRHFVERAYRTLLRREADADGLRAQLAHLRSGASRFDIIVRMRRSVEGRSVDPNIPGLDAGIKSYRRRQSGLLGLAFRLAGVRTRLQRVQIDDLPPALGELLAGDDEVFLRRAYGAVLGRDADSTGLQAYLAGMRKGATRLEVVERMRASPEGRARQPDIRDIDRAIARARRQRTPFFGMLLRWAERSAPPNDVAISGIGVDEISPPRGSVTVAAIVDPAAAVAPTPVRHVGLAPLRHVETASRRRLIRGRPRLKQAKPISVASGAAPMETVVVQISETFERLAPRSLARAEISSALSQRVAARADGAFPVNGTALVLSPALSNIVLDAAAAMGDRPTVAAGHDWDETGYPSEWIDAYNARLAGVGCATGHDMKVLIDRGASLPLAVIGVGVDHWDRFTPAPELRVGGKRFRFLHVSVCDAASGVDLLLESFGRAFGRDDAVTLIIKPVAGQAGGAQPVDVSKQLARLRAENRNFPDVVVVDRELDDAALKALYGHCHVYVSPGRAEGFGLQIARAFLSGLPVVTTGWGGQTDYCDHGNSWLVDYRFEYARSARNLVASIWAEPIEQALDDALWAAYCSTPSERSAKADAGRDYLLANYTWSAVSARISHFAHEAQIDVQSGRRRRIGWITTWNVKCGIATYSQHLLGAIPSDEYVVFAARQSPMLAPDEPNCVRSWDPGKGSNGLDAILREVEPRGVDTLMIQFNYGFYNHFELRDFIIAAIDMGKVVMIDLHSTLEPADAAENFKLTDMLDALRRCHRILAHGPADMNRLKDMGLVDNVMLFPHGVLKAYHKPVVRRQGQAPMIASFGFCFANKGLVELVQAVAQLKKQGRPVRLRMVNAEFPAPESADVVQLLKSEIVRLGLGKDVELHTEFLDDDACLSLLGEADLVVNPYQHTGESASGSVRYGLAIGRPVAVTPLSIFDDLGDAVFRMPGVTVEEIARGIAETLDQIARGTDVARHVSDVASQWRDEHDFGRQGPRLLQMATALSRPSSHEQFDV